MGDAAAAEAAYMAQKIEVERNNFQNALANDKKNMAIARKNAQLQFNNAKIGKAALKNYGQTISDNRISFQRGSQNYARTMVQNFASMEARATGKNLRGGMQDRFKQLAGDNWSKQRQDNRINKYRADTSAKNIYENALSQRDLVSRGEASILMPGSTGVAPGSGTLNMISGILGGGASGAAAGVSMGSNLGLGMPGGGAATGGLAAPSADSYMSSMFPGGY
jgi:hypothetical protein